MNPLKKLFSKKETTSLKSTNYLSSITTANRNTLSSNHKVDKEITDAIQTILGVKADKNGQALVQLTCKIFEKMGFTTKNKDGYNDQGRDIEVYDNNNTLQYVIQCKSYTAQNNKIIGSEIVKAFIGSTTNGIIQPTNRIFLTSGFFTENATKENHHKVLLIDRIGLINLLEKYLPNEFSFVINDFTFFNDFNYYELKNLNRSIFNNLKNELDNVNNNNKVKQTLKQYHRNCPNCNSKLKVILSKQKNSYYKCMTCLKVYYSNKDKIRKNRTEKY